MREVHWWRQIRGTKKEDIRDSGTNGKTKARAVAGMNVTPSAPRQPALLVVYDIPSVPSDM